MIAEWPRLQRLLQLSFVAVWLPLAWIEIGRDLDGPDSCRMSFAFVGSVGVLMDGGRQIG